MIRSRGMLPMLIFTAVFMRIVMRIVLVVASVIGRVVTCRMSVIFFTGKK